MTLDEFTNAIVDLAKAAAAQSYANQPLKLKGALAGLEACRGQTPEQLLDLLKKAGGVRHQAYNTANYWQHRCYEAEVEWVCNCVSAAMVSNGYTPIVTPTAHGMEMAAKILGVREQ